MVGFTMNRLSKFIGFLFLFAIQGAYDTFVIWGLVTWGDAASLVSDKTTIILLATPTLLVFNIILGILVLISLSQVSKKEKEEEEKKEFKMPDTIIKWFQKEEEKKEEVDFKIPDSVVKWFKNEAAKYKEK